MRHSYRSKIESEVFPLQTLGERIRTLRKQRKLTLEALAGEQLTKGMLSLIENNKANPSMDSLSYIAERLGVETAELLEEGNLQELRELLKTAERLSAVSFDELTDEHRQILSMIEPYAEKLVHGYEAARLLEIYGRSLYYEEEAGWQQYVDKAAAIYDQLNSVRRLASIGFFQSLVKFREHAYAAALDILLKERSKAETQNGLIDPLTRLDFYYYESIFQYAVGDAEEAIRVMKEGIDYSRENKIFYQIDDLYRLAMINAMMSKDEEEMAYYARKLSLYAELADDDDAMDFTKYAQVHYLTSYQHDYKKARALLKTYEADLFTTHWMSPYYLIEQGKVFYSVGKFKEAIVCFDKVVMASYIHHPFDLSIFYEKDAYAALCYEALGNEAEAKRSIDTAVDNVSKMPRTPYKDFIMKTYEFIQQEENR